MFEEMLSRGTVPGRRGKRRPLVWFIQFCCSVLSVF